MQRKPHVKLKRKAQRDAGGKVISQGKNIANFGVKTILDRR